MQPIGQFFWLVLLICFVLALCNKEKFLRIKYDPDLYPEGARPFSQD